MQVNSKQVSETGILFTLLAIMAGLFTGRNFFYVSGSAALLILLIVPGVFKPLAFVWFGFSKWLGRVISVILLSVIFYLLVMPVGMIRKVCGHDRLRIRQFNGPSDSTWEVRKHLFQPDDLTHTF